MRNEITPEKMCLCVRKIPRQKRIEFLYWHPKKQHVENIIQQLADPDCRMCNGTGFIKSEEAENEV